ncbi:MAG: 2-amino-4-hydroxy-6-hydroxymethyldihydropteridine diphosphokinase [Sphaerobacter sp.]|nr:2-amino-4-hydroxy-6-hydroxymethyldihydropteridine diphosphokinase [Sphaerobacter sp.]
MARAYLGLGANLGDRAAALRSAVAALQRHGALVAASSLYETAPVGYADQPPFLNAVIALETDEPPEALLAAALATEQAHGRVRTFRNAPRTLDVDLLLYDGLLRETPGLTLPHPRLHERAFVLVPLAEIAPELVHPRLGRTIRDLCADLGDVSADVRPVQGPEWATG